MTEDSRLNRSIATVACACLGFAVALSFTFSVLEVNYLPVGSTDALLLLIGMFALAGIPAAVAFRLAIGATQRLTRLEPGTAVAATAAAVLLALVLVSTVRIDDTMTFLRHSVPIELYLLGLAALPFLRQDRRGRAVWLAAAGSVAMSFVYALGSGHVESRAFDGTRAAFDVAPRVARGKTILLGVDGLCWETLQRWEREADNEDLRWFRERAHIGPLATLEPTESPRLWTSIATGLAPADHGVLGFTSVDVRGLDRPLSRLPQYQGASLWLGLGERLGLASTRPVGSSDMRRPPFWEIMVRSEAPVDVVGWWSTWPAGPLHGRLVTDRFYFWRSSAQGDASVHQALTHPAALENELAPLRVPPQAMTPDDILRFIDISRNEAEGLTDRGYEHQKVLSELPMAYTMDETYYAVSEKFLAESTDSAVLALYFRGIDLVSHAAMTYSNLYPESDATPEERRRYGDLVSRYYAYTFRRLRKLVELGGPDASVIVVSDHGFSRSNDASYAHDDAPDGVLMVLGEDAAAATALRPPHIYDVAPTLLWLNGYPVADDMPGRPLREFFPESIRVAGVQSITSYGARKAPGIDVASSGHVDADMIDLLRNLGYVE